MKKLLLLFLVCALFEWHRASLREAEPPEPEATPAVSAAPILPGPLDVLARVLPSEEAPETGPEPVVHCVFAGEGRYVRQSECQDQGGVIAEPLWAQAD